MTRPLMLALHDHLTDSSGKFLGGVVQYVNFVRTHKGRRVAWYPLIPGNTHFDRHSYYNDLQRGWEMALVSWAGEDQMRELCQALISSGALGSLVGPHAEAFLISRSLFPVDEVGHLTDVDDGVDALDLGWLAEPLGVDLPLVSGDPMPLAKDELTEFVRNNGWAAAKVLHWRVRLLAELLHHALGLRRFSVPKLRGDAAESLRHPDPHRQYPYEVPTADWWDLLTQASEERA